MGVGCQTRLLFLKPTVKNCSGLQPVVDWPRCWGRGLVAGDGFQAFPH